MVSVLSLCFLRIFLTLALLPSRALYHQDKVLDRKGRAQE